MSKCFSDVKSDLINTVSKSATKSGAFTSIEGEQTALQFTDGKKANIAANQINKDYRDEIVKPSYSDPGNFYVIEPSDGLVDKYLQSYAGEKELLQTSNTETSEASPETLRKVNEFLKRIGIEVKLLDGITTAEGVVIDANGRANLLKQLIEVVNGKENVALTEEAMHFAVEIIEQKDPVLFQAMLNKTGEFELYKTIINDNSPSSYRSLYQKDGKPDIRKIKKEVMGKLLAEALIEEAEKIHSSEQTGILLQWWNNIINALKNLFSKTTVDPFNLAAKDVLSGKLEGTVEYQDENYLQISSKQADIDQKLAITRNEVTKEYKADTDDNPLSDDADVNNWYMIAGRRIKNRVTDLVKAQAGKWFKDKVFSAKDKRKNEVKRSTGVSGHLDFEKAINAFVDPQTHQLRAAPFSSEDGTGPAIGNDQGYQMIYNYIRDLLSQHDKNSKIYTEVVIYDKNKDEAGTIDLLIVDSTGKANIYDWKFLSVKDNDIAWYKQDAFTTQIREYRRILKDVYSVKEFGETRAIPIIMDYSYDFDGSYSLDKMLVGSADTNKITDIKFIPVPVDETTGIPALDKKIQQLVNLYKKESKKSVQEGRRDLKADKLNTIKQTIRILRAQANLSVFKDTMEVNAGEMQQLVDKYNNDIKGKDNLTDAEKSDFAFAIAEQLSIGDMYSDIDTVFEDEIQRLVEMGAKTPEEAKELEDSLTISARDVRSSMKKLKKIREEFADVFIGQKHGVTGLLNPQKVVKGILSRFVGMSKLPLKSLDLLYKLVTGADDNARADALRDNEKIMNLRTKILEWTKNKGINSTKIFDKLYQKDAKGHRVHKLIDEIRKDFYDEFKEKAEEADEQWFHENIDIEAYRNEVGEYYNKRKEQIRNTVYPGTLEHQAFREADDIHKLDMEYNIDSPSFNGWGNFIMKRHIKDRAKWYTKEYKDIVNTPLEELYKLHQEMNKFATDIGYLQGRGGRTFTPFLRKTLTDKMIWGGNVSLVQDWIDDLSVSQNPNVYGETDENGNIIPTIPKYYTSDKGEKKLDKEGNEFVSYENVSEDMFKNLIAYNTQLYKYKYFSDIEGQVELIQTIEEFKGHLETDRFGNIAFDEETNEKKTKGIGESGGNFDNAKLLDDFVKTVLYKQRYAQSSSDSTAPVGQLVNKVKGMVNKMAGKEVFKKSDNPDNISMIKSIDALNRGIRLIKLSFNPISGAAVLFGNNIQVAAQSGEYFKARDYLRNQTKIIRHSFTEKETDLLPALLNTFLPMDRDLSTEMFNSAGVKSFSKRTFGDWLMIMMAKPDELLEKSVFLSLMDNVMVDENGKFVNINKYVKDKYPNRNSSGAERNRTQKLTEKEVKDLQASKAISKIAQVDEEGHLTIPGFDLSNRDEIIRVAQLSKTITRNANGNVTEFNKNQTQMNVFTASIMVFRNWIPTLTATRFAQLHKTADSFEGSRYDIGRVRLMGRVLLDSLTGKARLISDVINLNDRGLNYINTLFDKYKSEYEKRTGEEFEMNKDDFIDLIQNNIRNEVKELGILLSLTAALLSLGAMAPDDDDKRKKNIHALAYRTFDKMQNELSFFYNPKNALDLFNGSVFPSSQIFTDVWKFGDSIRGEIFDSEENNKHNRPIKRLAKLLPISSSWITYIGVVDPELAKELEVNIPISNQTIH